MRDWDSLIMWEKGNEIVMAIWNKTEERCGLIYGRARVTFWYNTNGERDWNMKNMLGKVIKIFLETMRMLKVYSKYNCIINKLDKLYKHELINISNRYLI